MTRRPCLFLLLSLLLLSWLVPVEASAYRSGRLFVQTKLKTLGEVDAKDVATAVSGIEASAAKALRAEFPCAVVTTGSEFNAKMKIEREKAFLGWYEKEQSTDPEMRAIMEDLKKRANEGKKGPKTEEEAIARMASLLDCQWMTTITLTVDERSVTVGVMTLDVRKGKAIHRDVKTTSSLGAAKDAFDGMAKNLVRALAYEEPCPYKGKVTVTVRSDRDKTDEESRPAYCNERDGTYRRELTMKKTSEDDWKLDRVGKPDTIGEVSVKTVEDESEEEIDDCHRCPSGREGGWTRKKETHSTTTIDALSDRSKSPDAAYLRDATVRLVFDPAGTFTIRVKATTEFADGAKTRRVKETAEGTCDNFRRDEKPPPEKASALVEMTWGPFPGTPFDKRLSGRKKDTLSDPAIGETTVHGLDFSLSRD